MRGKILLYLLSLSASMFAFACYEEPSNPPSDPPSNPFKIYVETNYKNQPDLLSKYGIEDMPMLYAQNLWKRGQDKDLLPSKDYVIQQVKKYAALKGGLNGKHLVLDVEHWNLMVSDAPLKSAVNKLVTVLQWAKLGAPQAKIGYYAFPPTAGYYAVQTPGSQSYKNWQHRNDLIKPIADNQQAVFPAYYALKDKVDEWKHIVTEYIGEAKRVAPNKPVYFIINPRYSPAAFDAGLRYDDIPYAFFKTQLEHIKAQGAAGVVIWGADLSTKTWDENRGWWVATKEVLGLK